MKRNTQSIKNKKIDLYTFIYNDEDMLPFFLDYYKFVDRMTFIDSGSDDNSLAILNEYAKSCDIRVAQTGLQWWDHNYLHNLRNTIWKKSDYDYIFFPDVDEIFYHPDIVSHINKNDFDIYEMSGYEMVGESLPYGKSILTEKKGVYFHQYNKSTIFKPRLDMKFLNAHVRYCKTGNVNLGEFKLLHYRNMGFDMMKKRAARERSRLPPNCSYRKFMTDTEIRDRYESLLTQATKVI